MKSSSSMLMFFVWSKRGETTASKAEVSLGYFLAA